MTTVLVVEDNLTVLESIVFELEMRDYDVIQATNGREALDKLQLSNELPDVLVSDIAMPDMNGYELLEQIRESESLQTLPVIFLTAFDSKNATRIGKQLGVDDYLVKPFEPEDLVIAIENKLKRTQIMHEHAERRLDDARRELTNLIAHELRTPLTSIYGSTEMLEKSLEAVPDELTHQLLQLLRSGSNRLNQLVERIVMLIQIESGQLLQSYKLRNQPLDLNTVITQVLQSFTDHPREPEIELNIELSDEPLLINGLEKALFRVVYELVDNAIKFSTSHTTVSLQTKSLNGDVQLIIQDKGRGIPQDQLDKVWGKFVQVDREANEQQGMGVGLTLVREVVRIHEGKSEIHSQVDEGTTVTISLPRVQPS